MSCLRTKKKRCNFGKRTQVLFLWIQESYQFRKTIASPKIYKRLKNVPGRPVISNCGTPTKNVSEFLDHHLKPVMQNGCSYIKDSGDFLKKIRNVGNFPENAILVTADVVGQYPNIPHNAGLKALNNMLGAREHKAVSADDLV